MDPAANNLLHSSLTRSLTLSQVEEGGSMIRLFIIIVTLMTFCGGCAGLSKQSELEKVAKD